MTTPETPTDCQRCRHDERTRGVIQLSTFELYPPDHAEDCPAGLRDRVAGLFRFPPGGERLGDATPGEIADAVLAVLPAPAVRAAALTEAADARAAVLAEAIRRVEDPQERAKTTIGLGLGWESARDVLRRMAAEAHDEGASSSPELTGPEFKENAENLNSAAEAHDGDTQDAEAHPAEHSWAAELHDPLADQWVPGTRYRVRDQAVKALNHARTVGPTWKDGTPTRRRLVRATTTYTVEEPAVPPCSGEEGFCEAHGFHRHAPAVPPVGSAEPAHDETGTLCVCGHAKGQHGIVSGRLLCDACDPDSTENLVCEEFDAL